MTKHKTYKVSPIKDFLWHEAIRLRPGMFLKEVNIHGFINNLRSILTTYLNALDSDSFSFEFIDTHTGILKFQNIKQPIKDPWSEWSSNPLYPFFLELSVLNALSEMFIVELLDLKSDSLIKHEFTKGVLEKGKPLHRPVHSDYLTITFTLDKDIWGETFKWHTDYVNTEIKEFAYLYRHVKFKTHYSIDNTRYSSFFHFENGLYDKVVLSQLKNWYNNFPILYLNQSLNEFHIEIAFVLSDSTYVNHSVLNSYVNERNTTLHGSHVEGVIKGIHLDFKTYLKSYKSSDETYRITKAIIKKNIIAEINIKLENSCFIGSTKDKLDNPEVVKPIAQLVFRTFFNMLSENYDMAKKMLHTFSIYPE